MAVITYEEEDYTPRWVGDLSKPLLHQFVKKNGDPHDLSGLDGARDFKLRMLNTSSGDARDGTGTWEVMAPPEDGQARYWWDAADVREAGIFRLQAAVTFRDGTQHFEIKEMVFETPL